MAESFKHIYKIDLNQPLKRFDAGDILASGDEKANSFEVAVCRDGANVDLTGCAVYGYFIRPNEETMKVDGTASGNKACVDLSKSCYVYDGAFSFAIKITGSGITQTVAVFDGRIVKTTSENIVDGDRVIYGLEDLLAQIAATEAAASSANAAATSANTAAGNANKWANAEAKATAIANGSQPTVNVTEKNGKKVLTFGVPAGATPDITFRVATGEPGTQVEIQQSGTPEAPVVDLTIPRGDTGAVDGIDYYSGNPAALGEASPGTANGLARGDHVHPMPTAADVGALAASGTATNSTKFNGNTWATMLTTVYPVGSIYTSVNSTSPASLFGGTWEQLKDRFLLGAGSSYSNGATGGEKNHTLTVNEMPAHIHGLAFRGGAIADGGNSPFNEGNVFGQGGKHNFNEYSGDVVASTGGSQPHNNMPPYLAVYMWKRVA
jgi:microcystin-dependent protein